MCPFLSMPPSLYLWPHPPIILFFHSSLHPSVQRYYQSGYFPELLLSLLSNWRPSAKKRPDVSFGCSRLNRASSVCSSSFLMRASNSSYFSACHLPAVCHALTNIHWHDSKKGTILLSLLANLWVDLIYFYCLS